MLHPIVVAIIVLLPAVTFMLGMSAVRGATSSPFEGRPFPRREHTPKRLPPQVGYKRAWLLFEPGLPFAGVSGHTNNYGVDSSAAPGTDGFHAYSDMASAVRHQQTGSVYLEVLLSGSIELHELGFVATHQRVLQVIFGECAQWDCKQQASYWAQDERGDQWVVRGVCGRHRIGWMAHKFEKLERELEKAYHLPVVVGQLKPTRRRASYLPTPTPKESLNPSVAS